MKYPVSCLLQRLLVEAGLLQPFRPIRVLDLTFGEGRFWRALPQAIVYGFDVRRLRWHSRPYRFWQESCEKWTRVRDEKFDLVVADPPFSPYKREKRGHYKANGSVALILYEAWKAARYFHAPLLIHFMWKIVPPDGEVIAEAWFQGWSRLTKMPRPTWFGIISLG